MRPTPGERKVSIGAIVLGYFTFAGTVVLLNVAAMAVPSLDPRNTLGLSSFPASFPFVALAAALAGYVAARSARRNETRHGLILGAVLGLAATASLLAGRSTKDWSIWVAFLIVSSSAVLGGVLRGHQQSQRAIREALK